MKTWHVLARTPEHVVLTTDGATLVLEASGPAGGDPDLRDVIARNAPHLAFGEHEDRGERVAISNGERVVVGRRTRGSVSIAYVLSSRAPVEIEEIVNLYLHDLESPFAHLFS